MIAEAKEHILVKDRVSYKFTPEGEKVAVRRVEGRHADNYNLSIEDARELYRNLLKKGYKRF